MGPLSGEGALLVPVFLEQILSKVHSSIKRVSLLRKQTQRQKFSACDKNGGKHRSVPIQFSRHHLHTFTI